MLKTEKIENIVEIPKFAVMFSAPWCGPCKPAKIALDEICREKGIPAFVIDADENPGQAEKYNVSGLPTILIFEDGKLIDMITGKISIDELRSSI